MEEWKAVLEFEGIYEVSSMGRVRALDRVMTSGRWGKCARKGSIIKPKLRKDGRLTVGLRKNGTRVFRFVHRLVCEAFHGPRPSPRHVVAHFPDRDPTNNIPSNLRWATHLENSADRRVHDTTPTGERNYFARLTEADVLEIRRLYKRGKPRHPGNQQALSERFGVVPAYIQMVANGQAWKHLAK